MFGAGYDPTLLSLAREVGAFLFVGLAIKLMDDFMDLRSDAQYGVPSLAVRLGEATLPYAMVLLALAALLDMRLAITLFLSSYAVGMAMDLKRVLPSGLTGWQEGIIAIGLGAIFAGPFVQIWSLVAMAFIQCIDDMIDSSRDTLSGSSNLVRQWGLGEIRLAALGLLGIAAFLHPVHTAVVVVSVATIEASVWRMALYRGNQGATPHPRGWLD